MVTKETIQLSQFGSQNGYYSSCGIILENVIIYPRWGLVVQPKTFAELKSRNKQYVERNGSISQNLERSIPQSVAIAVAYEVSWKFFQYFRTCRQNDISSVFNFVVVRSCRLHLHIKMAASISQISKLWIQISWEPEVILKNVQRRSFLFHPILHLRSTSILSELSL